jgi:hypothetical protein
VRAKNPKGRSSDKVMQDRVAEMMGYLAIRPQLLRGQLHTLFCQRWNCHWRTVDRILSRARDEMLARLKMSKDEFRCQSLAFYEGIASNPKAKNFEKLQARRLADEMFGAFPPRTSLVGNIEGQALKVDVGEVREMSTDELKALVAKAAAAGIAGLAVEAEASAAPKVVVEQGV